MSAPDWNDPAADVESWLRSPVQSTAEPVPDTLRQALAFAVYLLSLLLILCSPALVALAYKAAWR